MQDKSKSQIESKSQLDQLSDRYDAWIAEQDIVIRGALTVVKWAVMLTVGLIITVFVVAWLTITGADKTDDERARLRRKRQEEEAAAEARRQQELDDEDFERECNQHLPWNR